MENRRAVLSSASTTLEDLVARITAMADELQSSGEESVSHDLFEVERSLRAAHRRLQAVTRRLR